jgi:hypothetical protein
VIVIVMVMGMVMMKTFCLRDCHTQ